MFDSEWFHGLMTSQEAESLLKRNGQFLVRERPTQQGQFVLSVMHGGAVKHICLIGEDGEVGVSLKRSV